VAQANSLPRASPYIVIEFQDLQHLKSQMQPFVFLVCAFFGVHGLRLDQETVVSPTNDSMVVALEDIRLSDPTWYESIQELRGQESTSKIAQLGRLCESSTTEVSIRSSGPDGTIRLLYFGLNSPYPESKAHCAEPCSNDYQLVSKISQCTFCPCTITDPIANLHSYLKRFVDDFKEQCSGSPVSQNVLVVGLGAGQAINAMKAVCNIGGMHVIELNEDVIHASKMFFGLNASVVTSASLTGDAGIQILNDDGEHGVQLMAQKFPNRFDAVMVDCMDKGNTPAGCRSDTFYTAIRQSLKRGGSIYQWTWPQHKEIIRANMMKNVGPIKSDKAGWVSAVKTHKHKHNHKHSGP